MISFNFIFSSKLYKIFYLLIFICSLSIAFFVTHKLLNKQTIPKHYYDIDDLFNQPHSVRYNANNTNYKKVCVVIYSVDRTPKPNYLNDTVGALYAHLDREDRNKVHIIVNNVMTNTSHHHEAHKLSNYVDVQHMHSSLINDLATKQRQDYACSLRLCEQRGDYTIILEDDVVVTKHWFKKLERYFYELDNRTDYMYVKLFDPRWVEFDIHTLLLGCAIGGVLVGIFALLIFKPFKPSFFFGIAVGVWFGIAVFILLVVMEKPHTVFATKGLFSLDGFCCSQAHMYPRHVIGGLSDYLMNSTGFGWADLRIVKYGEDRNYSFLTVYPNLFQHVGKYSSMESGNRLTIHSRSFQE